MIGKNCTGRFAGYIAWARAKIDWLNPLVGRKDEWLGYRKAGG